MKYFIFILTITLFFCTLANGQPKTNAKLAGKVFDKSTMQPLEYATISWIIHLPEADRGGNFGQVHGIFHK